MRWRLGAEIMHSEEEWFGKEVETEVGKDRAKEGQQNEHAEEESKNDAHVFSQEVPKSVGFLLEGIGMLCIMSVLVVLMSVWVGSM